MERFLAAVFVCVLLGYTSSHSALAQESLPKCGLIMVNRGFAPPFVVHSPDSLYLAVIPGEADPDEPVRIYRATGRDKYVLVRQVRLKTKEYPRFVLVSNEGQLVTVGENKTYDSRHVEPDEVHIYSIEGKLQHVIDGGDVFTAEQLQVSRDLYEGSHRCTPINPWICWERPTLFEPDFGRYWDAPNTIRIHDTLGGFVYIDLMSGNMTRQEGGGACKMFGDYDSVAKPTTPGAGATVRK